jgi:hypothetical protein
LGSERGGNGRAAVRAGGNGNGHRSDELVPQPRRENGAGVGH